MNTYSEKVSRAIRPDHDVMCPRQKRNSPSELIDRIGRPY
jgi:hypothetical protein